MDMFILFLVFLFFSSFVLPWMVWSRLKQAERTIETLSAYIKHVRNILAKHGIDVQKGEHFESSNAISQSNALKDTDAIDQCMHESLSTTDCVDSSDFVARKVSEKAFRATEVVETDQGVEDRLGARVAVWVGGIALAYSGLFLVRYSIDHDRLSPEIRMWLAGMFGGWAFVRV